MGRPGIRGRLGAAGLRSGKAPFGLGEITQKLQPQGALPQLDKLRSRKKMKKYYIAALILSVSIDLCAQNGDGRYGWIENGKVRHGAGTATFSCNYPDPMLEAISTVRLEYGWRVSYEAPPFFSDFDLTNNASPKWLEAHPKWLEAHPNARNAKRVAGGRFTSTYTEYVDMSQSGAIESVLNKIVADYNASENPGKHTLLKLDDGSYDVVSASVKNSEGVEQKIEPILDTLISIPEQERSVLDTVEVVLAEITRKTGKKAILFTFYSNLLLRDRASIGGKNVSARSVLRRALAATNRPLLWDLGYDVNLRMYLFSPSVTMKAEKTDLGETMGVPIDRN
jgi:hypothetical protein